MQKINTSAIEREVHLTRLDAPPNSGQQANRQRRSFLARYRAFGFMVILPTLIATTYFYGLAADRYETQAQYVVRTAGAGSAGPLQALVQGTSVMRSADDAYITHAYIESRDAMRQLLERTDLIAYLNSSGSDFLWWYPGPFGKHSEEALFKRLQKHISVAFDRATGITTLKVLAFTPEHGRTIATVLLDNAEQLVNQLSERGRRDAIATAEKDVAISRTATFEAQQRITEFRRRNAVIDPGKVSSSYHETIARLALESAQIGAQVRAMQRSSPTSPQIEVEKTRIDALEKQILSERERLAGNDASLAPLIAEYETLSLERQLAEQVFGSSLTALEAARADGLRQRLFLDQIAAPNAPDYPAYPYRALSVLFVFVLSWAAFSVLRRFIKDARDHADL